MTEKDTTQQREVSRVMSEIEAILCNSHLDDKWICSVCMYMAWKTSTDLDKENTFMENAERFLQATGLVEKEARNLPLSDTSGLK